MCELCDAGSYQTGSGSTGSEQCLQCSAGTYQTGSGIFTSVQCTLCDSGTYQTGERITASLYCTACDAGTFQSGSGIAESVLCTSCDAGTYQTGSGIAESVACTFCDAGTYQTGSGVSASVFCALCDAGTYETGSGTVASESCQVCDAGTYQTGSGLTASIDCSFCDSGTFQTGYGVVSSIQCSACDSGTYQTGSGILASVQCTLCDSGTFQTGSGQTGSLFCTACDSGTYQTGSGIFDSIDCLLCDSGTYQTGSGVSASVQCSACDSGTYQTGSGSFDSLDCILCDSGTYQTGSGISASVSCALCDAGTYQTGSGIHSSISCNLCNSGTFQTGSGLSSSISCILCDAGTYQTGSGVILSVGCSQCDSGTYQTGSGVTASISCTLCESGTFQTGSGITSMEVCMFCNSGTYQTGSGVTASVECTLCEAGSYQTGSGSTTSLACEACDSGSYQTGSGLAFSIECTKCDAGTYQTGSGMTASISCTLCDSGTYQTGSGVVLSISCTMCDAGEYQTGSGVSSSELCTFCSSGTYQTGSGQTVDTDCTLCDAGTYQSGEGITLSVQCTLCSAGSYQTGSGAILSVECSFCDSGTYQSGSGITISTECILCDAGTYQTGSGLTSVLYCAYCSAGTYQTGSGSPASSDCTLCDSGTYQTGSGLTGSVDCTGCDAGTFQTGTGASVSSACILCDAGTYQTGSGFAYSDDCVSCDSGTFQTGSGVTASVSCSLCRSGTYQTGSGLSQQSDCTYCNYGTYQSGSGISASVECVLCVSGSYQTGSGSVDSSECILCDAGTFQSGSGIGISSLCTLCEAGSYQTGLGAMTSSMCDLCDSGTYETGRGAISSLSCTLCDSGKYSSGLGIAKSVLCLDCDAGTYQTGSGVSTSTDCLSCETGTYQTGSGMTDPIMCGLCSAGTYQTGIGITSSSDCILCGFGTYQTGLGVSNIVNCTFCPAGTYQTGLGVIASKDCQLCGAGTFQTGIGVAAEENCTFCFPGTFQTGVGITNSSYCALCEVGKYQSGEGMEFESNCSACGTNQTTANAGNSNLDDCECIAGYYGLDGRIDCTACKICHPNATTIGSCPLGSSADTILCACNAGFQGDGIGKNGCMLCAAGKYSSDGSVCLQCPAGSSSSPGSVSIFDCMCNAGYTGPNGGPCVGCDYGQYKAGVGPENCTHCPLNTISSIASTSLQSCQCVAGYSGTALACTQCPAGKYGAGGTVPCTQCKTCDSNATRSGSCPPGTGPADGINCQCNRGYNGNGISCSKQPLPPPLLLSVSPSFSLCVLPSQNISVMLKNLPATVKTDLSVSWTLGGVISAIPSQNIQVSVVGALLNSFTNLTITLNGPANQLYGFATFSIVLNVGSSSEQVLFPHEFKPYIVGPPTVSLYAPSFFYVQSNFSLFVTLQNLLPVQSTANLKITATALTPITSQSIIVSTVTATSLVVSGGQLTNVGLASLSFVAKDSIGNLQTVNVSFQVIPIPSPKVLGNTIFPTSGFAGPAPNTIQIYVQYLPLDATISQVYVFLKTAGNRTLGLKVTALSLVSTNCLTRICALHTLSFQIPSNPDGSNVSELVQLNFTGYGQGFGVANYQYISNVVPVVDSYSPRTQLVTDAGSKIINVFTKNFPSPGCSSTSCRADILNISILFGKSPGTVTGSSDSGNLLVINCLSPVVIQANSVVVTLTAFSKSTRATNRVSFVFSYTTPPAQIIPVDGSSAGGTYVTITAMGWGNVSNLNDISKVYISCGLSQWNIKKILSAQTNATYSSIQVLAQSAALANDVDTVVQCLIGSNLASVSSSFSFTYYHLPTLTSLSPISATVGGYTGTTIGNSLVITINGFPALNSPTDATVTFKARKGSLFNATALSVQNTAQNVYLTVLVPPTDENSNDIATVTVTSARPFYETRTASFSSFLYVVPTPSVLSTLWCNQCNSGSACIINGNCKNQIKALAFQVPLLRSGVLTIEVQNMYNVSVGVPISENLAILSFVGSKPFNVSLSRISSKYNVFGNYASARLEFVLPNLTSVEQCLATLGLNSGTVLDLNGFGCFDSNIKASCLSTATSNVTICDGPSSQTETNFSIIVRVFGPFYVSANESLIVTFGNIPAKSSSVINTDSSEQFFDLLISPPDASFLTPYQTVNLIISKKDDSASVTLQWTFWRPPAISSTVFDSLGQQIVVTFDQATNGGGMPAMDYNCSLILNQSSISLLSSNGAMPPSCVWSSDLSQLFITLGPGATVQPNNYLQFLSERIQSANGLSPLADAIISYINPPILVLPPVISVTGPTTVDPCASFVAYASGVSPRDLSFQWSCQNDPNLDTILRNLSPSSEVQLAQGTPEMSTLDKTYIISVTATDFLGTSSAPVTLQVLKKSTAAPTVVFWPPAISIFSNQPAILSSVAEFSSCPVPQDQLVFTWSFVSGPLISDATLVLVSSWSSPQAFVPANSLSAGGTYVFSVKLQAGGDASKFSEASISVSVGYLPVTATIAGGSVVQRSTSSSFTLDASGSRDLDIPPSQPQGLVFSWACSVSDGSSFTPCTDQTGMPLLIPPTSSFTVNAGSLVLSTGFPYVFSVTVQDSARKKAPSSAQLSVYIVAAATIDVSIVPLSSTYFQGTKPVINTNDELVLFASCSASISWSLSPLPSRHIQRQAFTAGLNNNYFIVAGGYGALISGNQYSFQATCSDGNVSGSSTYSININQAPSGGTCSGCLLDSPGCQNVGNPIFSVFRISCVDWADQNTPLNYRFGFGKGDEDIAWTAPDTPSFVDFTFPSGTLDVYAEVLDSFGGSSGVIYVTKLHVGNHRSSSARFLLQAGQIDWNGAMNQLLQLSQTQSTKALNAKLVALALELSTECQNGLLNLSSCQAFTYSMISRAREALSYVPTTENNLCATYVVVDSLTQTIQLLGLASIESAVNLVNSSARDTTYLNSIDQNCTVSATNILSNTLLALNLTNSSDRVAEELQFISLQSDSIDAVVFLYGSTLTSANALLLTQNALGSQTILRRDQSNIGQILFISLNMSVINSMLPQAQISLPITAFSGQIPTGGYNIYGKVVRYIPDTGNNLIPRSPIVGLVLFNPNSSVPLMFQSLQQPVNITIPLQKLSDHDWLRFQQQAVCVYWDSNKKNYSNAGAHVIALNRSYAVCQSNRLADFLIVQNVSLAYIPFVSTSALNQQSTSSAVTTAAPAATTVTFEQIYAVVGDLGTSSDKSWSIASLPWRQWSLDLISFRKLLSREFVFIGSSNSANSSRTLVAEPEFLMKTVVGANYSNLGLALTSSPPKNPGTNSTEVSAITEFLTVISPAQVVIQGFIFAAGSRRASGSGCPQGKEWRYIRIGDPPASACNCPPNPNCDNQNLCQITPSQGDQWQVMAIPATVCNPATPASNDGSTNIGLGIGLGLGIPVVAAIIAVLWYSTRSYEKTKEQVTEPVTQETVDIPASEPVPAVVFPSPELPRTIPMHSQLVFDAKPPSETNPALRQLPVFSEQPPMQVASYWDQGWAETHSAMVHQQGYAQFPNMPTATAFNLQDPAAVRYQM